MADAVDERVSMGERALMADPAPLGLAAFAFTTFLLSFSNAKWLAGNAVFVVMPLAMFYGGTMQVIAGCFEMRKGNTFGFTAFCSYGAFWWFYGALVLLGSLGIVPLAAVGPAIGASLILWGLLTLYLWVPAMFANFTLNMTFLFLWLAFFALGAGALVGNGDLTVLGGYFGLLTAFFASYTSFAIVTNSVVGAGTIPTGPGIRQLVAGRRAAASAGQGARDN